MKKLLLSFLSIHLGLFCLEQQPELSRETTSAYKIARALKDITTLPYQIGYVNLEKNNPVVGFSPMGTKVLIKGYSQNLTNHISILGDYQTGNFIPKPLKGWGIFSPDGTKVATSFNAQPMLSGLVIWNAQTGENTLAYALNNISDIDLLKFSHDGTKLIAALTSKGLVEFIHLPFPQVTEIALGDSLGGVTFSPDGSRLTLMGTTNVRGGRNTQIFDTQALGQLERYNELDRPTIARLQTVNWASINSEEAALFSPDGTKVIIAYPHAQIAIRNARTQEVICTLALKSSETRNALFSPDGTKLITLLSNSQVKIWDTQTGAELHTFYNPYDPNGLTYSAHFSPDGTKIIIENRGATTRRRQHMTSHGDSDYHIYNASNFELLYSLFNTEDVKFSRDGKYVFVMKKEGEGRRLGELYNAATGAFLYKLFSLANNEERQIFFTPDSKKIILLTSLNMVALLSLPLFELKTYFLNKNLSLQEQSLLVALDTISKKNHGGPIHRADLARDIGTDDTAALFTKIPQDIKNTLVEVYKISNDVFEALPEQAGPARKKRKL